jgi:hypothetical protein
VSRAGRSFVAAMVVLALAGLLLQDDHRIYDATSYGKLPSGHGALFDLLVALDLPVVRSFEAPERLPDEATVWWIEPRGVCDERPRAASDADAGKEPEPGTGAGGAVEPDPLRGAEDEIRAAAEPLSIEAFASRGGTAVVFLGESECPALAGARLPPRRTAGRGAGAAADASDEAEPSPPPADPTPGRAEQWVSGPLLPARRRLELPPLHVFEASGAWSVRAVADGAPFVLERPLGSGRVAVVADGTFLHNGWLDVADAAPLALDLVRAYGVPRVDEYAHGLRLETGALRYLAGSPAAPVFLSFFLLGLLFVWWGGGLARGAPDPPDSPAPTLEGHVASLAALYARSRDRACVAERYRELAVARIRRHFGLPPETPLDALVARLQRSRVDSAALTAPAADIRREAQLRTFFRTLDATVEEACR